MDATVIFGPVRNALCRCRGRIPEIEKATGIPASTLRKIVQGATPNPGVLAIERLYLYFEKHEPDLLRKDEARVQ